MTQSFPLIEISGSPEERGRQYGEQARDRIHACVAIYGDQLDKLAIGQAQRQRLIDDFSAIIADFDPNYLQEMGGIAAGAGVPLEAIVMINARTEVIAQARRWQQCATPHDDSIKDGCSGAVVLPERSRHGKLIHGQNWDWRAECAETSVVVKIHRDDGPDVLTFVEAGGLARSGLNQAGIAITANYLRCERDYSQQGVPLSLIRRKALEQQHMALAMRVVATTPKSCSNNMILSTQEGFAIDFECAPDESFTLYPQQGLLVHANHWESQAARCKVREEGIIASPDSLYRSWRVAQLLSAKTLLDEQDMKQAFFDDFGSPYSVCRPPRPGFDSDLSATVAMIVMTPADGVMEVAPLPAINQTFTRYTLD
ncbi:acyl-CoA:6-aminopenicillanic acid acyl transferase [Gibbsiella quercinecans]|uniref:Peptidase C45 n=1 Tax=Gibbsiella quercinecans TaxID=929813 RepID=A0A250AVV6_9GAMM|nr:C45 family peptidase [Gibbsiella quercinecans]ATA17991.1 peptidase C45 [Gibbsiella quercinecans]RLM04627.1 peptidase C45 [Gibbsiella quercinecans]RLM09492.1 peptidase C45 [Gibbsiella quercinecans]TCT92305.1 acyl-CoA:6-aminopenicillanic acid acyl transferase [Gibbsiella quercinecans]